MNENRGGGFRLFVLFFEGNFYQAWRVILPCHSQQLHPYMPPNRFPYLQAQEENYIKIQFHIDVGDGKEI